MATRKLRFDWGRLIDSMQFKRVRKMSLSQGLGNFTNEFNAITKGQAILFLLTTLQK